MKKIYTFFLLGELILFSIIFSRSVYDIYGLSHIGDTSLNGYKVEKATADVLGKVYDSLMEQNAVIQIIKMPISRENSQVTNYEIYHTNVDSIFHYVSVSDNQYQYLSLEKDDFIDGTGIFYTNIPYGKIQNIGNENGITVTKYETESYISMKSILLANGMDFAVLFVISFGVIFIYVISRNKENAVKILLGYSKWKIVCARIKETLVIELASCGLVLIGHLVYYGTKNKLSIFYVLFLVMFLCLISCINLLMIFLTCKFVNRTNVVEAIKNKMYSPALDHTLQIVKVVLLVLVAVALSSVVDYQNKLSESKNLLDRYIDLNDFYSSYGFNSDEYEKLMNNDTTYLETAEKVKQMYQQNKDSAYLMQDCVLVQMDEESEITEEEFYGMSREELFESYTANYIVVNENYLRQYISPKIISGTINDTPYNLLVPERYSSQESEIREYYRLVLEDKMLADSYYGKKIEVNIREDEINIVYIQDDYSVQLLSDLQYESGMDIEIKSPIIILDTGNFAATSYMDMLSRCELAFKLKQRDEFSDMLIGYGVDNLFSAKTMLAPFMVEISSYQFMVEQCSLFIALFIITLLFIIYISNDIHINVKSKQYGTKYELGYSNARIICMDILVSAVLGLFAVVFAVIQVNIAGYLIFVGIDLITLWILYRIRIVKQLYKIMNGGC